MKSAVLADSGPLYAAVDPDDAYHLQAQRELKRLALTHHDVIITYPTLLEAYTLVLHRLGRRNAANWVENILAGAALVNPSGDDYHQAAGKIHMPLQTSRSRYLTPHWPYWQHAWESRSGPMTITLT